MDFFSGETRDYILRVFNLYFQVEESAELLRKRLAKRPYFNIHDAFAAVDSDKNGYIIREELKEFLREYQFFPTDQEL